MFEKSFLQSARPTLRYISPEFGCRSQGTKKHRPRGNRFVRKNSAFSAPSGVRTLDTLIKSQVLYQLS